MNKFENVLIGINACLGIASIESLLGVIILVIQILLIIYKCGVKIYEKVKKKDYKGITSDIEELKENLEDLKGSKEP